VDEGRALPPGCRPYGPEAGPGSLLAGPGDGFFKAVRAKAFAQVGHQAVVNGFSDGLIVFLREMIRKLDVQQNLGPIGPVPIPVHDLTDDKTVG